MSDENLSPKAIDQLAALALRLEAAPSFMAFVLKQYRELENLTDIDLIARLETTPKMLIRLALCRRPDLLSAQFDEQIQQLAAFTGIRLEHLNTIIERIDKPIR